MYKLPERIDILSGCFIGRIIVIIFLKGVLQTLDCFIDCMAQGRGEYDSYVLDLSKPIFYQQLLALEPLIDETTHVITFNNAGITLSLVEGQYFWETKK